MVGVAGRSKGCGTCRKRRIRCGLQRPQCSNCIKSNRICTGYQRERVFIVNQTEYRAPSSTRTTQTASSKSSEPQIQPQALVVPLWKQKHKPVKHTLDYGPSLIPAYQQQLLASWLRVTLPSPSVTGPGFTPWTTRLACLPNHTPALATAITAVSLSRLSRITNPVDPNLKHRSLAAYTRGLWQLQKALWSPSEMYLDDTLAACLLLGLYELMECPGGNHIGYVMHQDGAARLVQLRGPERHQEGLGHALFVAYRQGAILLGLKRHEPTFLGEDEWLSVPWDKVGKEPWERMWDIMAQAPGIYARTDEMQRSLPERSLCIAIEVVEYCWRVDEELKKWYRELEESVPGPLYWPELAKGPDVRGIGGGVERNDRLEAETAKQGNEPVLFPVAYHFINLRIAMTLLSYWSLQTLFFNGMRLLYFVLSTIAVDRKTVAGLGLAAPKGLLLGIDTICPADCACGGPDHPEVPCIVRFDVSKLKPLEERINAIHPVREICQSVEYCTRSEMADMGWTSVVAPLNIAWNSIKDYDWCRREADWSKSVLETFEEHLPYLKCAYD
jgi:hypothetical protein